MPPKNPTPGIFDRGSFPKGELRQVHKNGIRRVNGRQVRAIEALGRNAEVTGDSLIQHVQAITNALGIKEKIETIADTPDGDVVIALMRILRREATLAQVCPDTSAPIK